MLHQTFTTPLTPRAFDAIVAQLAAKADHETTCCADVNGAELEWTTFFATQDDHDYGWNYRHEVCTATRCKLIGAWAQDDDGNLYAGDRDELAAMLGEKVITAWEDRAEGECNE